MSKCECGGELDSYIRNGEKITTCSKCKSPSEAKATPEQPVEFGTTTHTGGLRDKENTPMFGKDPKNG